jgi:hypothetical protein
MHLAPMQDVTMCIITSPWRGAKIRLAAHSATAPADVSCRLLPLLPTNLAKGKAYGRISVVVVGVAEWIRHLVVAQKTVGSNPTAHPLTQGASQSRLACALLPRDMLHFERLFRVYYPLEARNAIQHTRREALVWVAMCYVV